MIASRQGHSPAEWMTERRPPLARGDAAGE